LSGKTIIIIALLFGLVTAFLLASYFSGKKQDTLSIVVAQSTIKAGSIIDIKQLKLVKFPKSSIPNGSFQKTASLIGRVVKQDVFSNEPVLDPMLAPIDAKAGLSSTIAIGKRAITVRVNEVVAVAGFALPGSFVDVIVTVKGSQENLISKTVLKKVKVLAIAQETDAIDSKPKVVNAVTLELSPKEVEILDLARSAGNLSLALRNSYDEELSSGTTYQELVAATKSPIGTVTSPNAAISRPKTTSKGLAIRPANNEFAKQPEKVEIIKGNTKAEVTF
jgi:pilus assembly protein CpaB